ncbi:hypothetical protein BASA62_007813 [Batrachochytrium salamandrivorans]|nr:hypothetical protein BASA62_007813 [Batrachochytrium salamandrivorans]
MKLAAATLFSLVAIATYASPAAHPENRVDVQHSEVDEPVIVHLEKRAGDQQRFPETIEGTPKSADYKRRLQQRQNQQQRLRQQEEDRKTSATRTRKTTKTRKMATTTSATRTRKTTNERGRISGSRNLDFPRDKRPNLVGPSDKVVSQIGTTNQKEGTTDLARGRTLQQRQHQTQDQSKSDSSYQSQEAEDRRRMQSEEGKQCHLEYMRKLRAMQKHGSVDQRSQEKLGMATRIRGLPGPVPGVIKTEPPKPPKSILKKSPTGSEDKRRVNFNPLDKVATYDRSENQPPFDIRKIPSKSTAHTTDRQSRNQHTSPNRRIPPRANPLVSSGLGVSLRVRDLQISLVSILRMKALLRAKYPPRDLV